MLKKLDTLILRSFIGPFFVTFLIAIFVLVMQFFWLYIDDLVGKGIDLLTLIRLIGYVAATMVPLGLPLALLLSSIMTFGKLGESFELVAIKSAGIPLLRFMRPLFITAVLISGVAFLFQNNIIPVANLKLNALKYDIIVAKPAFDIKEGIFYDKLEGYVIKIGKKEKDDSTIRNVIIYEQKYALQDNIMTAESGIMRVTPDRRFMIFQLYNGWRYEEKGNVYDTKTQFIRMGFREYKKLFDLSSFKLARTQDSLFKYDPTMLSVRQLNGAIDSLHKNGVRFFTQEKRDLSHYLLFEYYGDSSWNKMTPPQTGGVRQFNDLIPDSAKFKILQQASAQLNSVASNLSILAANNESLKKTLVKHLIEWHRKFALAAACLVLFMIGAPLGSIIRKGGLGTPMVFAIIFFVLFYILNTFGEKFAKQEVISPFIGMWLSTAVLVPISIFLTAKAMRDSQLFNKEFYYRLIKNIRSVLSKTRFR